MDPITVNMAGARKATGLSNADIEQLIAEKKLETVEVAGKRLIRYISIRELLTPPEDRIRGDIFRKLGEQLLAARPTGMFGQPPGQC